MMYASGSINNSTMAVPMMPPPNYCPPPVYGNPFQPPFGTPFYPPVCNYYNSLPPPYKPPNQKLDGCQIPTDFSQPPPGYAGNFPVPMPPYQHVHMANIRSANFAGYPAPMGNGVQFSRPPQPVAQMSGGSPNNKNRFSNSRNNNRNSESREWPYFCESCNRGFTTLNKYREHVSQHKTCGIEGCTYSAHEKVVEKHVMMQHRTGLFNRIVKGYSPEEIQKWINERKKHFPTKQKIEVKEAQREEMKKRGERYTERRPKFNQRNSNLRHGPSNRFNRNASNRNGQFRNNSYGRRNSSLKKTNDENDRPQNKKRIIPVLENDDYPLRNILPFKGTAFYLRLENSRNEEPEEHTITDDDNASVWSDDEDITIIDYNPITAEKNVISELEKSSETSQPENNSEEDCLDKCFKKFDNVDVNDEILGDCYISDKNNEQSDHPKVQNEAPVNDSLAIQSCVSDGPALKTMSSLALLQCYDSDDDWNDDEEDTIELNNFKVNSPTRKIKCKKNDSNEDEERLAKRISEDKNSEIESSDKFETAENLSDDSEPDEFSSKCISTEENNKYQTNSTSLEAINSSINNESNGNIEPTASSLKSTDEAGTSVSKTQGEKNETKGCESKKRKRKRRRDCNGEVECEEESDKKSTPEAKVPRKFQPRKRYKPPTLLEKLLHREIKHERNVILQCIRYTVVNNYFGIGDQNNSS